MPASALLALLLTPSSVPVTPSGEQFKEPQTAVDGPSVFVVCGRDDEIDVFTSQNGGRSFGAADRLPSMGKLALGMRRGPRIAVGGGRVVVSAILGKQGGGRDGELQSWTSKGKRWEGPFTVTDVPGAAREGLHGMAASSDGRVACAWLDLRNKGTEVWSSVSNDGGKTWSKNVCVYRSPDGHVCECCHPSVAFGPKGELYVMFRNWLGGSRDMYLCRSDDGGKSFRPAQKLGGGTWPLNACPMDGGSLVVDSSGTVQTVWRRDGQVFTCVPGQPERKVGVGTQPWISPSGVVWQRDGKILFSTKGSEEVLGEGNDPSFGSSGLRSCATWADRNGQIWCRVTP